MKEFIEKWEKPILAGLLFLIFLLHLFIGIYMWKNHPYGYMHNDGGCYLDLAKTLWEKGVFGVPERIYYEAPRQELVPDAYRLPLLPLLTIPFFLVTGANIYAGILLQALLAASLSLLFYGIGKKLFSSPLFAFLLMGLVNLHPLIQNFTFCYSSELLFMVAIAAFLFGVLCKESLGKYILLGIAFAAAAYTRSAILPLLGFFPLVLLFFPFGEEEKRAALFSWKRWKKPLVFGLVAGGLLLPHCFRNYVLFDKFTPGTALGGFNIYIGNSRANLQAYRNSSEFLKEQTVAWKRVLEIADNAPPEFVRKPFLLNDRYNQEALKEYGRMSWQDRWELLGHKFLHFVRPWPNNPSVNGYSPLFFWGIAIGESLFFLGALVGLFLMVRYGGEKERNYGKSFLVLFLSGLILHLIVQVHFRYRIPFMDLGFLAPFLYTLYWLYRRKELLPGKDENV